MIKILFNDDSVLHDVQFRRDGHVITVIGDIETNTSGFTTWRMNGKTQLGDFSGHTTIYRVLEDGVQFSDDGSVWTEPEEETVSNKPTQEERITALEAQLAAYEAAYTEGVNEA